MENEGNSVQYIVSRLHLSEQVYKAIFRAI